MSLFDLFTPIFQLLDHKTGMAQSCDHTRLSRGTSKSLFQITSFLFFLLNRSPCSPKTSN